MELDINIIFFTKRQVTGYFFFGSKFPHKKNPETSRWKAPELVMRSRARCDLGDPQWDAKMRRSEHLSPDFFWTLRFDDPGDFQTWAGGLCEVTESCHRVYVDIPSLFFGGGVFPVVRLYYVGTFFWRFPWDGTQKIWPLWCQSCVFRRLGIWRRSAAGASGSGALEICQMWSFGGPFKQ